MKEMKRFLSLMLCLVMLVGMLPVNAFADEAAEAQQVTEATQAVVETAAEGSVDGTESTDKTVTVPGEKTENETTSGEDVVVPEESTDAAEDETVVPEGDDETVAPEGDDETVTPEGDDETVAPEGDDETVAPDGDDAAEDEEVPEETEETVPVKPVRPVILQQVTDEAASGDTVLLAEGESVVVVAGSDYQASSSGTTMTNIGTQIKEDYASPFGILMGGDYDAGDVYPTASHLTAVDNTIASVFPSIAEANRIMIQGNHETYGRLSPSKNSLLDATGAHDTDYYGVYAINYEDFDSASSGLKTYLDGKNGYTKPIFVITHQPLHETSRGDNNAAVNLFNVLNSYENLNIIFLFGHNHSSDYDDYLGGGAIYLKKGDKINVAGGSSNQTLNFTYMNCGYVGYSKSGADNGLTMTAFEITDSQVAVQRYDANGLHNLKAKGVSVDGYTADTNVYGTAVINLSTGESTISAISENSGSGDTDSGDSNTGSGDSDSSGGSTGGSGYTYELVTSIEAGESYVIVGNDNAVALMDNNGSFGSQNVTISGTTLTSDVALTEWTFSSATSGTITSGDGRKLGYSSSSWNLTGSGDCSFDIAAGSGNFSLHVIRASSGYNRYYFNYDGSDWTSKPTSTAYVRLYKLTGSGSGGGSAVTPEGGDWVTISDGKGKVIYKLDTDGTVEAGVEYLIVDNEEALALSTAASSDNTLTVELEGDYAYTDSEDYGWVFAESGSNYTIRLNGSTYLGRSNGDLTTGSSSSTWIVDHGANGDYYITQESNSVGWWSPSTYYLRYTSNGSKFQAGTTQTPVRLYKYETTQSAGDAEYAKLDGGLEYPVSRGATPEEALAAVKAGINVLTSASADGSNPTTLDDSNTDIKWELASGYDGAVPGEYAVTISYKGVKLGTAKVIVPEVTITDYDCQDLGSVKVGATGKVRTGANITVNLEDGTSYTVPVTMDMLSGNFSTAEAGTYTGLTVTYNGVVVCEDFTLYVREPSSYPEYPDEGAVQVNKTGTGIQFQSTGVAQIEVSASGIPMNQGVDVLLILDTSSSMKEKGSLSSGSRIDVLKECVNALIQNLKAERADGSVPDVDFSVVDFAGYLDYKSVNYIDSQAKTTSTAQRGEVLLDWTNVQNVSDTWGSGLSVKSGTNYDHGLEMGYDQLSKKQGQDNGARKQFVLFMSDGAPFQYNGVGSSETGEGNNFEKWLLGTYTQEEVNALKSDHFSNPEFYFESEGGAQKHRIAEAIKGSTTETFYIPSYTQVNGEWAGELVGVPGLGATMYSVGYALVEDYGKNPTGLAGMNAILSTIASVSSETGNKLFYPVTSKDDLVSCFDDFAGEVLMAATNARFVDKMGAQYDLQMGTIKDLNGDAVAGVENKIEILSYTVWTRSDYLAGNCTLDQIGDRKLDADGKPIATVLETITFNADGTEVYSDKASVGPNGEIAAGSNILHGGVIYAQSFWYNSNATAVTIDGVDIPTGVDANGLTTGSTNVLPSETFYWKVGTIRTTELAMRYYVYLEGSMEGTCEPGSYPTNEYANLYYNNYLNQPLGQPCQKPTFSPVMAWDAANVSYAFYLVDENGNIVVNQTTGETGSFANKIAVTNPVVYKEVLLNNQGNVESIEVASLGVLPAGYELYDKAAVYTVEINSDATGSWNIKKGDVSKASTYVTHYDLKNSAAYSNALTKDSNADFTHTVVWFAVLWKIQALPDSVVVDYGLPVDISVLTNDMFGENGKLAGVGSVTSATLDGHTAALNSGFDNEYKAEDAADDTLKYGDVTVRDNGKVRYTLNTMQMDGYDQFAYAASYTGATNPGYYYDTVTVIPATTIYYEDNFLSFNKYKADGTADGTWGFEGEAADKTQAEDRPGQYSLTDANNIYGYDSVNNGMSTFSLGQARKVHVDADSYATAEFTFTGTGFDVISMTSNTTGTIAVKVTDANGTKEAAKVVSTYYGYTTEQHYIEYTYTDGVWTEVDLGNTLPDGKSVGQKPDAPVEGSTYVAAKQVWVATPNTANALYQVPVLQIENLTYGTHNVLITASYADVWDETTADGYDLYLDAIRIYDPANDGASDGSDDKTIENAYKDDGEGWPSYIELRNKLIDTGTLGNAATDTKVTGEVFIDGDAAVGDAQLADYKSYGPNNEVYLAKNQRVAFILGNVTTNVQSIHLGAKSADGRDVTYTIKNIAQKQYSESGVDVGDAYNEKTYTLNTTTDMYYDITGWKNDIIVITNTSESILSLTNIKATYKSDPNAAVVTSENGDSSVPAPDSQSTSNQEVYAYMTPAAATLTLRSMNNVVKEPEETQPDESVPETTVPDPSEPEPSDPETSEPEESIPETTVPEKPADKQEQFQQAMKEAVTNMVNNVKKALKSLFGKWFR